MSLADERYLTRLLPWKRALHAGGAFVAIALAMLGWTVSQSFANYRAWLDDKCADTEACLEQDQTLREQYRTLKTQASDLLRLNHQLQSRLPDKPLEARFTAQLADVANHSGLRIESVRPGAKIVRDNLGELVMRVSGSGSYSAVCRFLVDMAELPRACQIGELRIAATDASGSTIRVEVSFHLLYGNLKLEEIQ